MRWFDQLNFRLKSLFQKEKLDEQLSEEIREHVAMATEANIAKGMSSEEARHAAMREFGGVEQIKERTRDEWGWVWLGNIWRDLRYTFRQLAKAPGFTLVVVLTLAFGIGVNTALFTWFNAAAFRPLPVLNPEQLFSLSRLDENGRKVKTMAYADFVTYRNHQAVFSDLAASSGGGVELADSDSGEKLSDLRIEMVSTNYFAVFGVPMALGRPLVSGDETSSRALPVIVLSHRFWQNDLGGDPNIIGRTLHLRGLAEEKLTVVGVAGPEFFGTKPGALAGWVPLLLRSGDSWRTDLKATGYTLTGRLRPGVSQERAVEELQVIANELLARSRAGVVSSETIVLDRASTYLKLTAQVITALLPMICLFGAVLLVSCANASNLILARAVTRQFEFAVRSALGASRWRLFGQIMIESLVLGCLGGLLGWVVAAGLLRFVWPWLINMMPMAREGLAGLNFHADHRVFGFTLAISLLAGVVGGLFPALQVTRRDVDSALKREGSTFGRRLQLSRVRSFLAVAQLTLSSMLLFTAGLLVHRALGSQFRDVGFDQSRLVTFEVLAPRKYEPAQLDAARRQVLERLRALPSVAAISEMTRFPFARSMTEASVAATDKAAGHTANIIHLSVPANYFSTLQLPLIRGRAFASGEIASDQVAVISETAARLFWPDGNALGRDIEVPSNILLGAEPQSGTTLARTSLTVIGIVRDTKVYDPWNGDRPVIFLPLSPQTEAAPYLLIRTNDAAKLSLASMQQVGREATGIDPRMGTVAELFDRALIQYRVMAWVAGILAALSLFVAVIGLYGVMSFTVNQRVKEIGIRIALGATPNRIVSGMIFESLRIVAMGVAMGYGLSVVISIVARTLFFGVSAFDPLAFITVTLLLGGIGIFACWLPARRAAKVDPMVSLRCE